MQDQVKKEGKWTFDDEVTKCFDNMLVRSIPDYYTMRYLVGELGKSSITSPADVIVDYGCSVGGSIEPFVELGNKIYGIEVSKPMYEECKERFKCYPQVEILPNDIVTDFPEIRAKLAMSILTIQFTPIEERWQLLKNIYDNLEEDGCFIFVEKILASSAEMDGLFTDAYYNMKRKNGYTEEQIFGKRKSLAGVLVPALSMDNEHFLYEVGFRKVECFWRCLNFAGWIARK
jgi:tRNA (cmo5U34)-methyltransferase